METLTLENPLKAHLLDIVMSEVEALDFQRIKFKLSATQDKGKIDIAEHEYKRFLVLIKMHPSKSIVPSKIMDEFWHLHILDTEAYRRDCKRVFGRFIDHFPYFGIYGTEDRQSLIDSFEETKELYLQHFGTHLVDSNAARCQGKPCHVTTSCRCRG